MKRFEERPTRAARARLGALGALALLAAGHPAAASDGVEPGGGIFQARRTAGPITIDGRIDEAAWRDALRIPLLYETNPAENVPPPVETECLILYDTSHLYVAFRALDPDPSAIRAHLSDRDTAWDNDFVGVALDTFNDERRAFEFWVNPLGVQMDTFLDDVGGTESESWDAIWDSAGRITDSGFEVEMAIPFHQLRFPATDGTQTWGIDILRFWPRSERHRIASQPRDRDIDCYLCQVSKVQGFEGVSPGRNLEIVPTVVASRTDAADGASGGDLERGSVETDPGVTVRWGVTPNMTLGAAVNPDFSQVEADVAQLDVNNQFALFFEERRPFFLEGADFFDTSFNAVFTRNVADPDWGAKLTGKAGRHGIGVFAAQDSLTNLLFPGSQGSRAGSFDFETLDATLRYRTDFGKSSAIGALLTSRSGPDYENVVGGIDGRYRFSDADSLTFQYLSSQTEYPDAIARDFGQPIGSFGDSAYRLAYSHNDRSWTWYGRWEEVGSDFRADMGFMPKVGYSQLRGGLARTWWGGEDDWWNRWGAGGDWDSTEDEAGHVLERELEVWTEFWGPRQSYLWVEVGTRDQYFDGVTFDGQEYLNLYGEIQPTGDVQLRLFAHRGEAIDFANTRPADQTELEGHLRWNVGKRLRVLWEHDYQQLDVDEGELFTANLSQLRLVYQINVRTFVRAILQYRRVERDPSLYRDAVSAESEGLFSQLLYSYKLNPQTVLFLGYSDNRAGAGGASLTQTDRTLFVKLGYAWNL